MATFVEQVLAAEDGIHRNYEQIEILSIQIDRLDRALWNTRYGSRERTELEAQMVALQNQRRLYQTEKNRALEDQIENFVANTPAKKDELLELKLRLFWRNMKRGEESVKGLKRNVEDSAYLLSAFAMKPDPLGRFMLMDMRYTEDHDRTIGVLSGAPNIIMGGVYIDKYEENGDFVRQHGGPGARIIGAGIGSPLYMSSAVAAHVYFGADGSHSPSPGNPKHNRTDDADTVWESLNKYDSAYREGDNDTELRTTTEEHCANVSGDDHDVYDDDYGEVSGTVISSEVCGDVTVEYEVETGGEADFLPYTALEKTKFLAFAAHPDPDQTGLLSQQMSSKWDRSQTGYKMRVKRDDFFDSRWKDGYPVVAKETAELMVRALHGDSVNVVLSLGELIQRTLGEDMMVAYLQRPDVAKIAATSAKYLELLGQQRLPGLSGLSNAAHREVMTAVRHARLGAAIDYAAKNPLRLPPMSASLRTMVAKDRE